MGPGGRFELGEDRVDDLGVLRIAGAIRGGVGI